MCKWCPTLCFLSCLFRPLKIPVHMWETCFALPFNNNTGDLLLLFLGWSTGGPGIKPMTVSETFLLIKPKLGRQFQVNFNFLWVVTYGVHYCSERQCALLSDLSMIFFLLNIFTDQFMYLQKKKKKEKKTILTRWKQWKWQLFYVCAGLTFCSQAAVCVATWTAIIWYKMS